MIKRFLRWLGFMPKPIPMGGIYGITEDGCYIVLGNDGVLRKTPPLHASTDNKANYQSHDDRDRGALVRDNP